MRFRRLSAAVSSCAREVSRIVSSIQCSGRVCLAVLLLAAPAIAQTGATNSLSLQAAMDRAFAANPTIAAARLSRAINVAGRAVAAEYLNPEVTVEIEKETPKQALGFVMPLELGGKRAKRIAVSEAAIRTGEAELSATIAQVRNDVRRTYFDVAVAQERLVILQELRDLSRRVRDSAQARFESGESPRLEVLQADLAVAAAENEATAAEAAVIASTSKLNAVLGLQIDTRQQLTTALDVGGPVTTDVVMDLARTGSSELAVFDRRIAEQRAKVALAQALRAPDLMPGAALTHDAQPEFTYGWRAGLIITLPIFTSHKAGVLVEESTLAQLNAQREATLLRITGDVTAATAIAEAQRLAYMRYRDAILPQAQQVEQLAQDAYQFGQTGIAALLQALQASRDVRLRAVDAAAQFQTALADLERAIGTPLP